MNIRRIFTITFILTFAFSLAPGALPIQAASPGQDNPASQAETLTRGDAASQATSLPEGVSADWWARAQEYIQQSEYDISWQEPTYLADLPAAYQASNRAQGIRTYFTPQSIRLIPRLETEPAWQLGISLAGYGDQANLALAGEAVLSPVGNRMDYPRGELTEWYVNEEAGLQQGIVLHENSVGAGSEPAPTNLDLTLQGTLTPVLTMDGRAIEFFDPDGSLVLRYGDLQVVDAAGQSLIVDMDLLPGDSTDSFFLRLTLPASARPLTFTARITSPLGAELTPDNLPPTYDWTYKGTQGAAEVGSSVGTAGDVNGDGYDDIIVGAWFYDNGNTNEGRVFVWYGSATGLCNTTPNACPPDWTAEGEQNDSNLGYSVGTAGDVNGDGYDDIIVGTPYYNNPEVDEGGAFVWYGSATGLGANGTPANADWKAESNQASAWFGFSVGTAGDVNGDGYDDVIVGARYYDNPESNEGAAFVWYGSAVKGLCKTGETPPCSDDLTDARWRYQSNLPNTEFGFSVGTAGDVNGDGYSDIIVGTPLSDEGYTDRGKVYVWLGSSTGIGNNDRAPNWSSIGEGIGNWYGWSVGTAGDVDSDGYDDIVVGARYYNNGHAYEGAVYVYYGTPGNVGITDPAVRSWKYESNQVNTDLGGSVSTAGDINNDGYADIIVGYPCFDFGQTDEGAVGVWYGSAVGMGDKQRPPDWIVEINHDYDYFGSAVATAGDVNGDGYSDLLVGAYGTDEGGTWNVGQVYVYYGSPGTPPTYGGKLNGEPQGGAQFGYSVATAGDVNGDGYSDIIVGSPYYDAPEAERGKVFVWYGSADSRGMINTPPDWTAVGETGGGWFGCSVGTAGDVNGDGYDDIIVGAHYYPNNSQSWGAVYVWYGSAGGLGESNRPPDWRADTSKYATNFGYSVGTAGDVDGDGFDDIVVGAPWYDNGQTDEGAIFVWEGSADGLGEPGTLTNYDWMYESNIGGALFGYSVGTAGDLNGDGLGDIIAGTLIPWGGPAPGKGKAYVWYGASGTGLGQSQRDPDWSADGLNQGARFGIAVSTAGDVNGDGYSDIIVGANGGSQSWWGAVFVWYGSSSGLCQVDHVACSPDWMYESGLANTVLGTAVGPAGDVNGDGYADILVGAPDYEKGLTDEGAVYIFYGSQDGMGADQRNPDWLYKSSQWSAKLGFSVNTAGDVDGDGFSDILAGSPLYDREGVVDAGVVFIFHGSAQGLSAGEHDSLEGDQENGQLGFSVASAGDVNGDGYGDVIAGAPYYLNADNSVGRVYVYLGSATGIVTQTVWIAESGKTNAQFGAAVGSAGDVNGDGYGDVIVGAPGYTNGETEEGAAFVWYGSAYGMGSTGDPSTAAWHAEGDQLQAYLGSAVASAGDVNCDGYGDVIVGAYGYDNGQTNEGQVRVYLGSAGGLAAAPAWTAESDTASAAFGKSAGSAGDVNGDGCSEVIVGAYKFTSNPEGEVDEGAAFVWYGSPTGLGANGAPANADWKVESNQAQAFLGSAVSTAGDVNGDGFSDVVIGAYQYTHGTAWQDASEGAVFVWYGSAGGLGGNSDPAGADWQADSNQKMSQFGYAVSAAGDVNGDGYSDIVVGAPNYNNGPKSEGRAYVYYGSAEGLSQQVRWTAEGDQGSAGFGRTVAAAGDISGDGFGDVIVGAPNYDYIDLMNTLESVGLAQLYHGNSQGKLSLRPRQMRVGAATPIAPLGLSDSETSVRLRFTGLMPLGREMVKLEWQIAPLGTPFTATGVITGATAWIDTGDPNLPRVEIVAQVVGLAPGTAYHWRVRMVYSGNRLGLGASRWFSPSWNGWQELDFRTPGLPPDMLQVYLPVVKK